MGLVAEDAEEGGHEAVVELIPAEELVDLGDDPRRLVGLGQGRPEQVRGTRPRRCAGPEPCPLTSPSGDGQPAGAELLKVEEVAPRLLGGEIPAGDVVTLHRGGGALQQ